MSCSTRVVAGQRIVVVGQRMIVAGQHGVVAGHPSEEGLNIIMSSWSLGADTSPEMGIASPCGDATAPASCIPHGVVEPGDDPPPAPQLPGETPPKWSCEQC